MGVASILLALAAMGTTVVGFLTTPIPTLGAVFAFGAPVIALAGVVVAGRAQTAAKRRGDDSELARAGMILNVLAFIPALLVALTCGVCNAVIGPQMQVQRSVRLTTSGPAAPSTAPVAGHGAPPPAPPDRAPSDAPLPPPPLPAGPRQQR